MVDWEIRAQPLWSRYRSLLHQAPQGAPMGRAPRVDVAGGMSRFCQWLSLTHTQRYNARYRTNGEGHHYEGRYKSFAVQDDEPFLSVCL